MLRASSLVARNKLLVTRNKLRVARNLLLQATCCAHLLRATTRHYRSNIRAVDQWRPQLQTAVKGGHIEQLFDLFFSMTVMSMLGLSVES